MPVARARTCSSHLAPKRPRRIARLDVRDQLIDLGSVKRVLDTQQNGQPDHVIAIGHEQITCGNITMPDGLDCLFAGTDQQRQLARASTPCASMASKVTCVYRKPHPNVM